MAGRFPFAHAVRWLAVLAVLGCTACGPAPTEQSADASPAAEQEWPTIALPPTWTPIPTEAVTPLPLSPVPASPTPAQPVPSPTEGPAEISVAPLEFPGTEGEPIVAFSSSRSGDRELYLMRLDGSGLTQLTDHPGEDNQPRWAPDGGRLAFVSWRETEEDRLGFAKAMIIDADGGGERLLGIERAALFPSWSPDGKFLAVAETTNLGIFRPDGSLVRELRNKIGVLDRYSDWSPNGRLIAFNAFSNIENEGDLFTINLFGFGLRALLDDGRNESAPAWSPDGEWLAFSSQEGFGLNWDLYKMRPDGSEMTLLTKGFYPRWSPDGEWISFMRSNNGLDAFDLYLIRPDGTDERRLTDWPGYEGYLDWRPMATDP